MADNAAVGLNGSPQAGQLDSTQATDSVTDIDSQELYDAGLSAAADAAEPNTGAVIGYDPAANQRRG